MNVIRLLVLAAVALLVTACASVRPAHLPHTAGATRDMNTLTSAVSLSIHTEKGGLSARGYLFFRQPADFRLVLTSPFGATLAEIASSGDAMEIVVPGKRVVYRGSMSELPPHNILQNWGLLRWVMESLTTHPGLTGVVERLSSAGVPETIVFDGQSLVEKKTSVRGDEVQYQDYRLLEGVAVPERIVFSRGEGETVRLVLEEPEVNQVLDDGMLHPDSAAYAVLPLGEFKGF